MGKRFLRGREQWLNFALHLKAMRKPSAIIGSTFWISINEFLRNQWLLLDHWKDHYASLGLSFPGAPLNGAVWGIWALAFSAGLYFLFRHTTLLTAVLLGWLFGFLLMWLVIGNLGVLPSGVLPYAVPWSMIEVAGAVWIMSRVHPKVN